MSHGENKDHQHLATSLQHFGRACACVPATPAPPQRSTPSTYPHRAREVIRAPRAACTARVSGPTTAAVAGTKWPRACHARTRARPFPGPSSTRACADAHLPREPSRPRVAQAAPTPPSRQAQGAAEKGGTSRARSCGPPPAAPRCSSAALRGARMRRGVAPREGRESGGFAGPLGAQGSVREGGKKRKDAAFCSRDAAAGEKATPGCARRAVSGMEGRVGERELPAGDDWDDWGEDAALERAEAPAVPLMETKVRAYACLPDCVCPCQARNARTGAMAALEARPCVACRVWSGAIARTRAAPPAAPLERVTPSLARACNAARRALRTPRASPEERNTVPGSDLLRLGGVRVGAGRPACCTGKEAVVWPAGGWPSRCAAPRLGHPPAATSAPGWLCHAAYIPNRTHLDVRMCCLVARAAGC